MQLSVTALPRSSIIKTFSINYLSGSYWKMKIPPLLFFSILTILAHFWFYSQLSSLVETFPLERKTIHNPQNERKKIILSLNNKIRIQGKREKNHVDSKKRIENSLWSIYGHHDKTKSFTYNRLLALNPRGVENIFRYKFDLIF